ncbi:phage tail assembly chaperone family protein, TAC [uncultured Stenotrophomonas sp.]|uniref:phage tail assembly chaperone family protein, TAC n=1 Tax=uncultured Stenotrophomonas sp. TaxID=165438 RepID=UPI0025CFCA9F|nr:phage tail assembly chaperone family protein, TAC [uncultured Stenotrophomonas sp.]
MKLPESLFVSPTSHKRPIKLPDGNEHTFNFRELPSVDFRRIVQLENSKDADERASAIALAIAMSIVDDDGARALSMEQAAQLKPAVSMAMWEVIVDVNKFLGKAPSSPEAASGSDTSSP